MMSEYFKEVQQFRQRWIWILLICSFVALLGCFGYGLTSQVVFGKPFGDKPMSDVGLIILTVGMLLFELLLLWFFYAAKLIVVVDAESIQVRFFPLARRKILLRDVERAEACTYSPLREYGGWGIRWGASGMAYNVSGNRGVRLRLKDKKEVLIGSQKPDALEEAVLRGKQGR